MFWQRMVTLIVSARGISFSLHLINNHISNSINNMFLREFIKNVNLSMNLGMSAAMCCFSMASNKLYVITCKECSHGSIWVYEYEAY